MSFLAYDLPADMGRAKDLSLTLDGTPLAIGRCAVADYALCALDTSVNCCLTLPTAAEKFTVRPAHAKVQAHLRDNQLHFVLDRPGQFSIELPGRLPLYLFVHPLPVDVPSRNDPRVRFLEAGRIHDLGRIELKSGETLYLEGGAVLRGHVFSSQTDQVTVRGHGIMDGTHNPLHRYRLMQFDGCRQVRVEGITGIGHTSWNIVPGGCDGVAIRRVNLISWLVGTDGIDVVGSRNVAVEDCFLRNNDDCIVLKASDARRWQTSVQTDWRQDVQNVRIERCVCYNDKAGNVFEIGFETRTDRMADIVVRDCDVIGAHGEGAVFSIHAGDRARVENVLYEDIRVEHFYDKLVDFRILSSRWSKEDIRGHIRGVTLRKVRTNPDIFNSTSVIGGFDAEHRVEDIHFEDFWIGDKQVIDPDGLHLFTNRHIGNITFA